MTTLNAEQLSQYAANAGFRGSALDTIVAIALAESGGRTDAVGDNGQSYGLLQYYQPAHPGTMSTALDPQGAFNLAWGTSKGGTDFSAWSTWKNGAYKQFLGRSMANPPSQPSSATSGATSSLGSMARWILAFGVLAAVGLAVADSPKYGEVGVALLWVTAIGSATAFGPAAWKELQSTFGVSVG